MLIGHTKYVAQGTNTLSYPHIAVIFTVAVRINLTSFETVSCSLGAKSAPAQSAEAYGRHGRYTGRERI